MEWSLNCEHRIASTAFHFAKTSSIQICLASSKHLALESTTGKQQYFANFPLII